MQLLFKKLFVGHQEVQKKFENAEPMQLLYRKLFATPKVKINSPSSIESTNIHDTLIINPLVFHTWVSFVLMMVGLHHQSM